MIGESGGIHSIEKKEKEDFDFPEERKPTYFVN